MSGKCSYLRGCKKSPLLYRRRHDEEKEICFLSEEFYNDYPADDYPEIEQKHNRPYIQVFIEIAGIQFAIPLRSDIKHPFVLWTEKKSLRS